MSYMIVIEGVDAVGKHTQAQRLAANLDAAGRQSVVLSFPRYESVAGRALRRHLMGRVSVRYEHSIDSSDHTIDGMTVHRLAPEDPLFFQAMMLADKAEASADITAHLNDGRIVICDRWVPSALCFGAADGLDGGWLDRIHGPLPLADLNLLVDVPEEEALRRRPQLRDRYEKDRAKQAAVREKYDALWRTRMEEEPDMWARVDGVGSVDDVAGRVWSHVERLLTEESE